MSSVHNSVWTRNAITTKYNSFQEMTKPSFWKDVLFAGTGIYPFKGLYITLTQSIFWKYSFLIAISYVVTFIVCGAILYVTFIPLSLASGVIVLGPIGLVILHIQWILITNFVANEVCSRLIIPNLNWQVWKLTLAFYDIEETPQLMMKEYENPNLKEESNDWWWIVKGVYHVLHFNKKFILIALSIVPILGPLTVNMIEARDRSIKCLRPFFKQMGWSKSQVKEFKLEKKPQLILFGLTSGILDSIPFVSILTNTSNLVGGSLWAVDIMNQEGGIELDKLKGE